MPRLFTLAATLALLSCLTGPIAAPIARPTIAKRVALDIGHFPDPPDLCGAKGHSGTCEYVYNKALAQKIGALLEASGIKVMYTEGKLIDRPRAAEAAGVSLFISIHHDSVQEFRLPDTKLPGNRYRGYSLFVSKLNPKFKESLSCASKIGKQFNPIRPRSLYHADDVPGERKAFLDEANGVHRYDNWKRLAETDTMDLVFCSKPSTWRKKCQERRSGSTRKSIECRRSSL